MTGRELVGCRVCGALKREPDTQKNGYKYGVCSGCGVSMIEPMANQDTLDELYQKGFMEMKCDGVDQSKRFSLEYKETYFAEKDKDFIDLGYVFSDTDMKVLDVGCANGLFLDYLIEEKDIRAQGIDVSIEMIKMAVKNGFACKCEKIEEAQGLYDLLTMWDTLEHIREPAAFLKKAAAILNPGGDIIIQTPCRGVISDSYGAEWIQYQPPYHVHLFDFESLKLLLEKVGFDIVSWVRFGSGITEADLPVKPVFDRVAKEMKIGDTIVLWAKKR
ncbi:MAG: methyltransferase domain-containing protein [Proteobacteria bacterium]|nr:methyltransferase domain-containing protein [Pseudomonadota bacterium]